MGRPYFVMELVRGIRITDYCDQNNLSTKDRLDLFIKVCQAIQHAHQKGIIQRDIKSSNALVTLHDCVPMFALDLRKPGWCVNAVRLRWTSSFRTDTLSNTRTTTSHLRLWHRQKLKN